MKAPLVLDEVIAAFGRTLEVSDWSRAPTGAAELAFENGFHLHLEATETTLYLTLSAPYAETFDAVRRLLICAHPDNALGRPLHATLHPHLPRALWTLSLPLCDADPAALHTSFQILWRHAERLTATP